MGQKRSLVFSYFKSGQWEARLGQCHTQYPHFWPRQSLPFGALCQSFIASNLPTEYCSLAPFRKLSFEIIIDSREGAKSTEASCIHVTQFPSMVTAHTMMIQYQNQDVNTGTK